MKNYPTFSEHRCSDAFIAEHSQGSRSSSVTCEACGRTSCCDEKTGTYEPGEYLRILGEAAVNKKAYIFLGNDINSIAYGNAGNMQFVFDCPCNYAGYLEKLVGELQATTPPSTILVPRAR